MYGYPYSPIYGTPTNYNQPQQTQDERIWVQNEASAEAYLVAPSGFARLWSANDNKFYEKRADATGRPLPMEIYEYKRISPKIATLSDEPNKLSSEDIDAKIEALSARIEALEKAKKGATKNVKQSDTDDTGV